ncbi:MAG: GNAT family N-acetyltransferase [Gemmatimonadota bacterium]
MNVRWLEGPDAFRTMEPAWRRLESDLDPPPFLTYDWARLWHRHLAGGATTPAILVAGDPPRGLLAMVMQRLGSLRLLRPMGHGISDYLGPLADEADPEAWRALGRGLAETTPSFDVCLLEGLRAAAPARRALQAASGLPGMEGRREICPAIDARGSWPAFLAGKTKNFRAGLRRTARRVDAYGTVTLGRERPSPSLLRELEQTERASWKWEHGLSFFRDGRLRAFVEDLLLMSEIAAEVWTCRVGGELAAFDISLLNHRTRYSYQTAYRSARSGTGTLLLAHVVRATFESGLERLDLMQGDDAYKRRWASETAEVHRMALARGARGRALLPLLHLRWRMPRSPRLRQSRVRIQRWCRNRAGRRHSVESSPRSPEPLP